jgi:hypothetical protein
MAVAQNAFDLPLCARGLGRGGGTRQDRARDLLLQAALDANPAVRTAVIGAPALTSMRALLAARTHQLIDRCADAKNAQ